MLRCEQNMTFVRVISPIRHVQEVSWKCHGPALNLFFPLFLFFLILYKGRNLFPCVVLEPSDQITRLKNLSRFHYYAFTRRGEDFTLATLSHKKS